jgi:DNA-binding transcriptional MocR family regulator
MTIDWTMEFAPRMRLTKGSAIRELLKLLDEPGIVSFAGGIPDPALFPRAETAAAAQHILGDPRLAAVALQYAPSEGYAPLRRFIARSMAERGVACAVDNILVASGSQQALDFIGRLFLGRGDTVLVARPTYLGALQAFSAHEPVYGRLPRAGDNRLPDPYGPSRGTGERRAKLAYAVADFQNPTGESLSLAERRDLVAGAAVLGLPLVEDAAYEQLRYEGAALPSLLAIDTARAGGIDAGAVLYCGTFSKTIAPGLRIGWVTAPRPVIDKLVLIKQASDLHTSTLDQMVLHEVASTIPADHLATIRRTYRARRDAMLAAIGESFPAACRWTRPEGGMFIWVTLPEHLDAEDLLRRCLAEAKVAFVPGRSFHADNTGRNTLRLNFSLNPEDVAVAGIRQLGGVLHRALAA